VYLDTQDFSRFGDVLRGRSDAATEKCFVNLEAIRANGDAVFAASMPLIGELLQYDASFRETTMKKAEAVERLCGAWALAYPSRLVGFEIAHAAFSRGLLPRRPDGSVISCDRYWYPNIRGTLDDVRGRFDREVREQISRSGADRATRRRVASQMKKLDYARAAREAAPDIEDQYGIPAQVVGDAIAKLLRKEISADQAATTIFESVAEPTMFVQIYFEKLENDRSLPHWISGLGRDLEKSLLTFRDKLLPLMEAGVSLDLIRSLLNDTVKMGSHILRLAADEGQEFGFEPSLVSRFEDDEELALSIPACATFGGLVKAYLEQILGFAGPPAKIERSVGGDLVHALYLPYVDLWRGDRRFSELVRQALPQYREKVVHRVSDLPERIAEHNRRHCSIGSTLAEN